MIAFCTFFWLIKIPDCGNYLQFPLAQETFTNGVKYPPPIRFQVFELTLVNLIFSCFSAKLRSLTFLTFSFTFSYLSFSLKIATSSSWLISMSTSVCDIKFSMLFSLLLANIRILSCFFFLFLVMLSNFLIILVVRGQIKVELALASLTGAPTTLVNQMTDITTFVALESIKTVSM